MAGSEAASQDSKALALANQTWDRTEIPFSKGRLLLIGAVGWLLPVTAYAAVHYALESDWSDATVLGVASIQLLLIDVWIWRRILTNRPALVFLPDALIEQASFFKAGRIERTEISGVRVGSAGWWRIVYLDLHPSTARKRLMTPGIIAFPLGWAADELAYEIRRWLEAGPRS